VIAFTNLNWLDPLVSVLIGVLILWNAWGILRQTIHILLESTPESINLDSMVEDINNVDGVQSVHDLHVWSINESLRVLSAHIVTDDMQISQGAYIQKNINEILAHKYNIQHATHQLECTGHGHNSMLYCEIEEHSQ
jgi:cobalt-zinc-cadmium efflux system protein